jgi:cysteinyl-tRNA synthetase
MAERYLGPLPFDIHAGGQDLIFPHHENEIAQSCCARGLDLMAHFWLHNGFVQMAGEKMAKSVGNVVRVAEVLERFPGEAVRLWLLSAHYRQPLDCTEEALREARDALRRWYRVLADNRIAAEDPGETLGAVDDALADDLATPAAIAVLHGLATRANKAETAGERDELARRLKGEAALLGLLGADPAVWLKHAAPAAALADAEVEERLARRRAARTARDFATADALRAELEAAGIVLKDRPDGRTDWERR